MQSFYVAAEKSASKMPARMSKILVLAGFSLVMFTAGLRGPNGLDAEQTVDAVLAAMAWTAGHWRSPDRRSADEVERDRERSLEGARPGQRRVHADHLGRHDLPADGRRDRRRRNPRSRISPSTFQRTGESVYYGQAYVQSRQDQVSSCSQSIARRGTPAVEQDPARRAADRGTPSDQHVRVSIAVHRRHSTSSRSSARAGSTR